MNKRHLVSMIGAMLAALLLYGCSAQPPEEPDAPTSPEAQNTGIAGQGTTALRGENQRFRFCSMDILPGENGNGAYLMDHDRLNYLDLRSGERMVLCSQPGCRHTDATCPAYIPKAGLFGVYGGMLYIQQADPEGNGMRILVTDPAGGTCRELLPIPTTGGQPMEMGGIMASHGRLYIQCSTAPKKDRDGSVNIESFLYSVDLSDPRMETLLHVGADDPHTDLTFFGASQSHMIAAYSQLDDSEPFLSYQDYVDGGGDGEKYDAYIRSYYDTHMREELRLYSLDTMEHTVISDSERGYRRIPDMREVYGDTMVYLEGDTLQTCDLETGSCRSLTTMEGIVNYYLLDGRVFFVTESPASPGMYQYWHIGLDGGDAACLDAASENGSMIFTPKAETEEFFLGMMSGPSGKGYGYMTKEDFYAESYDKVQPINW